MELNKTLRRAWAEIDMSAAAQNFRIIKEKAAGRQVCVVIKADGYGHGAVRLGRLYRSMGADLCAVSNIEEAIELREGGVALPILILGYTPVDCADILAERNISQCVYSVEYGRGLADAARRAGVSVKIHIKIDSGMGRIGFACRRGEPEEQIEEHIEQARSVCLEKGLVPEGIFTHFAVADEGVDGDDYTASQNAFFRRAVEELQARGIAFRYIHSANSAAIFDRPEAFGNTVRAGIVLYGLRPSARVSGLAALAPVMSFKTVVSHIKRLYPGESVSYGRTWRADGERVVATLPVGYADGLFRAAAHGGFAVTVESGGETFHAPLVGRVCMDQCMVDLTDFFAGKRYENFTDILPLGSEVTLFGAAPAMSADDLAEICGTIGYEITCAVSKRVPRVTVNE